MSHTADISADEALQRLIDGNERLLKGETRLPGLQRETLAGLANGQHPFATILGCSDTRVPQEWIFDAGIGELFVVRGAGNVLSPEVVAEKLITKDKVVMLGGGYASSVTAGVAGVAQQNRLPFLINTGSADDITEKGFDYVFRLNPPASEYSTAVEDFLATVVKPASVAILYENSKFGTSSAKEFSESCKKLGIKVLMNEGYEHGGIDYKPLLIKVKQANPDVVYMVSYVMDAALLMRQSRELKLTPKLFIGGGAGFTLPEFPQNAGKASEKVLSATLWHETLPLPGAAEYFKKFKARFNKDTEYHGAEAYAAAYVIADVLKRAKSLGPDDIKQALKETDMMTVFGPVKFVSFDKKTNQNKISTYVVQCQNGQLKLVWPQNLANAKYVYPVDWLKEWGY